MNGPCEGFYSILDASQLLYEVWSADTLYDESGKQLTSDKLATWGEADWGKSAEVEVEDWVRTEIIVGGILGEKRRRG